jgi:hypothetical protein
MLTQEQIQNLKPGDKLLVEAYFLQEGCSYIKCALNPPYSFDTKTFSIHPYALSLPSEHGTSLSRRSSVGAETEVPTTKHAPTRLFKKGDKVRIVDWQGKKPGFLNDDGTREAVVSDPEDTSGTVELKYCGRYPTVAICFLELVTPVEELEPYKLIDSPNTYNIVRDSAMVMTIHKKSHPNAKAAAEAECARLNAEWRKEQK